MKYALRVAVVWHGTTMQEILVRGGNVTLGGPDGLMVPGDEEPLVLAELDGEAATVFPLAGMTGRVMTGDRSRCLRGAASSELRPGDAALLHLGDVTFYLQWVKDDASIGAVGWLGALAAGEGALSSTTAVSATAHGMFLLLAFLFAKPNIEHSPLAMSDVWVRIMVDEPPGAELLEEPEVIDEFVAAATDPDEAREGQLEAASSIADVSPDPTGADVEVEGGDAIGATALSNGIAAALGRSGALTNIFGTTTSINDTFTAVFHSDGNPSGDGIAGLNGPGMVGGLRGSPGGQGTGRGPVGGIGGDGREVGGTSTNRRVARVPEASMTRHTPAVDGGFLSRQQIETVVRRHSRGMRSCYERALVADAELAGSVSFSWTIGLDGRVVGERAVEDTIGSGSLASCLRQEIRRMHFPEPDGGMVVVTYPFRFDVR